MKNEEIFIFKKNKYSILLLKNICLEKTYINENINIYKKYVYNKYKFYWGKYNKKTPINITNLNILPIEYKDTHYERIKKINKNIIIKNPIMILIIKNGFLVIDGIHRIIKATLLDMKTINVYKFHIFELKRCLIK
jgi:hypothetical protein